MRPTGRKIATEIAHEFDLTFMDFTKCTRVKRIAHPRQAAMYAVRRMRPDLSYPRIGRLFGGRDHTTIMYGIRQVAHRLEQDPDLDQRIGRAMARAGGDA